MMENHSWFFHLLGACYSSESGVEKFEETVMCGFGEVDSDFVIVPIGTKLALMSNRKP